MLRKSFDQARNATKYSLDGLVHMLRHEFAARLEVYGFAWTFGLFLLLDVPAIFLLTSVVLFLALLAMESLNTAVEVIIDRVSPEISPTGKHAKDLGSFAVMCVIAANVVHAGYVLWQVDYAALDGFGAGREKWLVVSSVLFLAGLYFLIDRKPQAWRGGILAALTAVFLVGAGVWFTDARPDLGPVALGVVGVLCAGVALWSAYLVFDLTGRRIHTASAQFARLVRGGEATRSGRMRRTILGTLAVIAAFAAHPQTANLATDLHSTASVQTYVLYD